MTKKTTKKKADKKPKQTVAEIRQEIVAKIVAAIESGVPPWRKPWSDFHAGFPTNVRTQRRYRGTNPLILLCSGFSSQYWGTAHQWSQLGGIPNGKRFNWGPSIRKGESASVVINWFGVPTLDEETQQPIVDKDGNEKKRYFPRRYPVFNVDQMVSPDTNLMAKRTRQELTDHAKRLKIQFSPESTELQLARMIHERIDAILDEFRAKNTSDQNNDPDYIPAEELIVATGADIRTGGNKAFYRSASDFIKIPPKKAFKDLGVYYETVFHELAHWSENPKRLGPTEKASYGFNELVAELTAAFMMIELGVPVKEEMLEESKTYLAAWLKQMKEEATYLFNACSKASQITDYLLAFVGKENPAYQGGEENAEEYEGEAA